MFQANTVATETYRALELFTTAAAVYFCVAFPVSLFTSYLERKGQLARAGRAPIVKPRKPAMSGVTP
jgi:polar amino acid transport system permease protein